MKTFLLATFAGALLAVGYALAPASPPSSDSTPVPRTPPTLVAHEWGTFTSFSGADGVPVGFTPNNTDLPNFVYYQTSPHFKSGRFSYGGLVSMETPVIYFYADKETRVSVKVDFPKGWITEWYPYAQKAPQGAARNAKGEIAVGQSIRWDVRITPGAGAAFPVDKKKPNDHYYAARTTDAAPVVSEVPARSVERDIPGRGAVQSERHLFYRGVGTFQPPVVVKALGDDKVRVVNNSGGTTTGMALVTVRGGKVGFRALKELGKGETLDATIPSAGTQRAELGEYLVKELTAAGLFEKEARAMVNTWDSAWFGEEGTRLLYLVPRAKTDELLPLAIEPKPTEVARVLVGRHDFLTPEQEAAAEAEVKRLRAARKEVTPKNADLKEFGRFGPQALQMAAQRLDARR
jgi:hypothetical protein